MRPALLFPLLALSAGSFACFHNEEIAPVYSKNGRWPVGNIEETTFYTTGQATGFISKSYNKGEKAIEFNEKASVYSEFENGNLTRSGTYSDGNEPNKFIAAMGKDTVYLEILSLNQFNLLLKTEEKTAIGSITRMISTERR